MKNIKTKVILSVIIFLSVAGFVNTANAAGASLYVSPASLTKTVGDTFGVSVGFNASGNKVCAAEGTLVFNNISCQSITLAGDVTPQSSPTCSNPHFLIGVPSCTTADKVLFTVSVTAGGTGMASISSTGVDIIGEGVSIGSASINGNYTINAVPKPAPVTPQGNNGYIGYVNGKIQVFSTEEAAQQAGATAIEPNYQRYPAETTPAPVKKGTATIATTIATTISTTISTTIATTTNTIASTSTTEALAAVASADAGGSSMPMWAWLALLAVIVVGAGWWVYRKFSCTK